MSGTLSAIAVAAKPLSPTRMSPTTRITLRPRCVASVGAVADSDSDSRKSVCLYEILRIKPEASAMEIKSAYRRLAKRYHPDSDWWRESSESGGEERFIEIHEAYATLSDPAARSVYDSSLEVQRRRRTVDCYVGGRTGFCPTRRWETDQCW